MRVTVVAGSWDAAEGTGKLFTLCLCPGAGTALKWEFMAGFLSFISTFSQMRDAPRRLHFDVDPQAHLAWKNLVLDWRFSAGHWRAYPLLLIRDCLHILALLSAHCTDTTFQILASTENQNLVTRTTRQSHYVSDVLRQHWKTELGLHFFAPGIQGWVKTIGVSGTDGPLAVTWVYRNGVRQ